MSSGDTLHEPHRAVERAVGRSSSGEAASTLDGLAGFPAYAEYCRLDALGRYRCRKPGNELSARMREEWAAASEEQRDRIRSALHGSDT